MKARTGLQVHKKKEGLLGRGREENLPPTTLLHIPGAGPRQQVRLPGFLSELLQEATPLWASVSLGTLA